MEIKKNKLRTFKKNHSDKTLLKYFTKWQRNKIIADELKPLQRFITKYSVDCGKTVQEAEQIKQEHLLEHIKMIVISCIHNTCAEDTPVTNADAIYMRGLYSYCKSRKDRRLTFLYKPGIFLRIDTVRFANPLDLLGFDAKRIFEEYQITTELKITLSNEPRKERNKKKNANVNGKISTCEHDVFLYEARPDTEPKEEFTKQG